MSQPTPEQRAQWEQDLERMRNDPRMTELARRLFAAYVSVMDGLTFQTV